MRSINLLPPEIARQEAARRRRYLWVVAGVAYLAVLGYLTFNRMHAADQAEQDVVAQQQTNATIQAQIDSLAGVEQVKLDYEAAVGVLDSALGGSDVSWGTLLNDLGRLIPDRVWLSSFSAGTTPGTGSVGTITVSGTGFDYTDIAAWLRTIASDTFPGVTGTWVSTLSSTLINDTPVINFSSTTSLTTESLSDRVRARIPEVP